MNQWFADSSLEGNGFELPVPREIGSGFEVSAELGPIDRRRGGIIRAVVGLGKPIELLRCLEEYRSPPHEGALRCWRLRGIAELTVRIHSPPAESPGRT
jgi:hypothetical protein